MASASHWEDSLEVAHALELVLKIEYYVELISTQQLITLEAHARSLLLIYCVDSL